MKKVIVTGGAGFIGSHLVDRLVGDGLEVIVLDNLSTGKKENVNPKAQLVMCDISKAYSDFILHTLEGVDTIFHLAATPQVQYSIENPTDNNNLNSIINILEASRLSDVKRVIFSSSSALYGEPEYVPIDESHPVNPLSPYALHKLVGEQYCKLYSNIYDLDTVCLRYFNVYGNRMNNEGAYKNVISVFIEQTKNKEALNIVNDGEQKRDYVHVNDIVEANILAATHLEKLKGTIFNVGTSTAHSVNEIASFFGGEKKYGEKRIEPKNSIAENNKLLTTLDWAPRANLKEWIKNCIKS